MINGITLNYILLSEEDNQQSRGSMDTGNAARRQAILDLWMELEQVARDSLAI